MKVKDSLPEKHIQTDETVTDWRSAVKLASQPLLDEALITSAYIEARFKVWKKMVLTWCWRITLR